MQEFLKDGITENNSVYFIKSYLSASKEQKEQLENGVLDSFYMKDFSCLCYAMWMAENDKSLLSIDEDYVNLINDNTFKYFVIPKSEELLLRVSSKLQELEDQFSELIKSELYSSKKTDVSVEDENSNAVKLGFPKEDEEFILNPENYSEAAMKLHQLQTRCYCIFTHLMEHSVINVYRLEFTSYNPNPMNLAFFLNKDAQEMRMQDIFKQRMLSVAASQSVVFNDIPLTCSSVEAILYLNRTNEDQYKLIENFLQLEKSDEVKDIRFRRIIYSLPYLNETSLNYLKSFVQNMIPVMSEGDINLIEYASESAFIPDENINLIEEVFELSEEKASDQGMMFSNILQEAVSELPEEIRNKFNDSSMDKSKGESFLSLEFNDLEDITKESVKEKIISLIGKLDSNSHEDIQNMSDLLYEWFNINDLNNTLSKAKKENDTGLTNFLNMAQRMSENSLKPKIVFTKEMEIEVQALKDELPNFTEMIDFVITEVKLNLVYNGKMAFTPILLLGDPGLGKTYVAKEIARILRTASEFIDFGSTSASWLLKGSSQQWKSASCGKILEAMTKSTTINPLILYDEVDKGVGSGRNYPPEVVLYQLFEKNNAVVFEDEFMGMSFDASSIINICTANTINHIPQPLLSRLTIFEIKKLEQDQTMKLARKMYAKMIKNYMIFAESLPEDMVFALKDMTPREIDKSLRNLLIKNTKSLSMEDILKLRKEKLEVTKFDIQLNKKNKLGW